MSTAALRLAERVFLEAMDLPPEQRADHARRACANDQAALAEVLSLLEHSGDSDPFLDSNAAPGRGMLTQLGAAALAVSEPLLPPDQQVGGYTVLGVLGSGGMGVVYLARQAKPARLVALKVMRWAAGGSSFPTGDRLLKRFEHEADILGRLHHPGIAQIFEAGSYEAAGGGAGRARRPFIAMELVQGRSITDHARSPSPGAAPLTARARIELVRRACDAVQHAHLNGIIHRDLKPGNVLVTASGDPKIVDFGVARLVAPSVAASMHTAAGELMGTLPYMAPEQVADDANRVDARADVYALGVILYELLAERLPLDLRELPIVQAARRIADDRPPRLGTIVRSLRGDVESIVAKALEKNPADRYQSAAELRDDLGRFLEGLPILVGQESALSVLRQQLRRYRRVVFAAAGVGVALTAAGMVAWAQAVRANRLAALEAGARERADANAARLADELANSDLERGRLLASTGNLVAAEDLIWPAHLRSPTSRRTFYALWELYMREPCLGTFTGHAARLRALAVSPDHRAVASIDAAGTIVLRDAATTQARASATRPSTDAFLMAFTGDSRWLLVGDNSGAIHAFDTATLKPAGAIEPDPDRPDRAVRGIVPAPDKASIWVLRSGGWVERHPLRPDAERFEPGRPTFFRVSPQGIRTASLAVSPDGGTVAVGADDAYLRLFTAEGRPLHERRAHSAQVSTVAFSPDGTRLATGGGDRAVILWSLGQELTPMPPLDSTNGTIRFVLFSADGRRAYSGGWWTIDAWDAATGRLTRRYGVPPGPMSAGIDTSRNTLWLAAQDALQAWELGEHPGRVVLDEMEGRAYVRASADGRLLVTGDDAGVLRFFDSAGEPLATIATPVRRIRALRWNPRRPELAVAGLSGDIALWDCSRVLTDRKPPPAPRTVANANAVAGGALDYSPDGELIAFASNRGRFGVVRVADGRAVADLPGEAGEALWARFSRDGRLLATVARTPADQSKPGVRVWSTADWSPVSAIFTDATPWAAEFSADGSRLYVGDWNRNIVEFDVATARPLRTLTGHNGFITDLRFRPNEPSILISSSADGTVRLWDLDWPSAPSALILDAVPGTDAVNADSFAGGRGLAIGTAAGQVHLLDLRHFNRHIGGNMDHQLSRQSSRLGVRFDAELLAKQGELLRHRGVRPAPAPAPAKENAPGAGPGASG